jgi:hypothetical protein
MIAEISASVASVSAVNKAKSRRFANGLVSSAISYLRVGIRPGHFCLEGKTTTDRDLDLFLVRRKNAYSQKISVEVLARLMKGKVWLIIKRKVSLSVSAMMGQGDFLPTRYGIHSVLGMDRSTVLCNLQLERKSLHLLRSAMPG